jgi:small-conductance mechanosensitive channel/CRP-like cAMP-binding protein
MEAFWTSLRDQALFARTPYLVLGYVLIAMIARGVPPAERPWLRYARNLLVLHLVLQVGIAVQAATGYSSTATEVASLACETLCVVGLGNVLLFRLVLPRLGWMPPRILVDIFTALAIVVALIVVGKRAGFSVAGLITTSAVLTAVIGFSLQDTLGNMMGGLALQMDNSVRLGDWISLGAGQPQGRVIEIRWRYTAIETRAWETIIIPNGILMKSQVVVAGRRSGHETPRWRRQIEFFVDYRTPPSTVIDTVTAALRADPPARIVTEPQPHVLLYGFKDSYASYLVRYWITDLSGDDPPDSDVRVRVYYALSRAGIPLSMPAQAVFVTQDDAARTDRKADRDAAERLAALDRVDLFRGLDPAMRAELAAQFAYTPFAQGEAVTHEGAHEDGLYMIVRGDAVVRIGTGDQAHDVARLGPGQVFGEMSLMTGEARAATVIAATDLVCYRVDKPVFEALLRNHPEVAEQVADVLAARKVALDAARGAATATTPVQLATEKQDLLGRIRGFFGLRDERE